MRRTRRRRSALGGQTRRTRRAPWLLMATAVGFGAGVGWSRLPEAGVAPTPRLQRVAVTGSERIPAEEVARSAGLARGAALSSVDLGDVAARVAAHPWIAGARVAALAPDRLLVAVDEREPRAVAGGPGAEPWWVDASGTPFAKVQADEIRLARRLPKIEGADDLDPARAHPALAQAVVMAGWARDRDLPRVDTVVVGGEPMEELPALVLDTEHGPLRVILGPTPEPEQLDRVARLLAGDLAEVHDASALDVRFGAQVVLRSDSAPEGAQDDPVRGRAGA